MVETGSRKGAEGSKSDPKSRSRVTGQQAQDRRWRPMGVYTCPVVKAIQERNRRGVIR